MSISPAISYYAIAFFICLSCLIYYLGNMGINKKQNRVYLFMHYNLMAGSVFCIISYIMEPHTATDEVARVIYDISYYAYYLMHGTLPVLFFSYMIYVSDMIFVMRRVKRLFTLLMLPFLISELMIVSNPLTHWIYSISADGLYVREAGSISIYMNAVFYVALSVGILLFFWRNVPGRQRIAVTLLFAFMGVFVAAQLFVPELQIEVLGESITMMAVMLLIENEEKRIDLAGGVYNRSALESDLKNLIGLNQPFKITVAKVRNLDSVEKISGIVANEKILVSVAAFLKTIHPVHRVYKASQSVFVLLTIDGEEEAREGKAEAIMERFESPWKYEDVELSLRVLVMEGEVPTHIKNLQEIFVLTDSVNSAEEYGRCLKAEELGYLTGVVQIEKLLYTAIEDHNLEVYYQPTYNIETKDIHSAEALIRLNDPRGGMIPPRAFLPVAERINMMEAIDNFVFEESCLFLASGLPVEMGIEYISINLSMVQIMRPNFVQYATETVKKYDIRPSLISFEIKEEAAARDFRHLTGVMETLRKAGFRFSMDSFGTGFSDMQSVYALHFDLIKIDRMVLEKAEESLVGRIILENCIQMIHEMNKKSLIEGVEREEQVEVCRRLGVDYMQGYYTSKPITRNELLGVLRVTELARMEERRARAASEAKSSFLANMSHEIRTPINAVLGMNEMILRECDEEGVLEYAKEIESAGQNLLSLINNILDYSKIEASEMEIVNAGYDLAEALDEVVRSTYIKTHAKSLAFVADISPDLPLHLYGDEFRLKQIMMNLLNNAVKYTTEGSVRLGVDGERQGSTLKLEIKIQDTGCGIREDEQDKLFQMFQRLDMEKNMTIEGTGLGLAITQNLLKLMGGDISVSSVYGEGSCFTARLEQKIEGGDVIGDFRSAHMEKIMREEAEKRSFTAPDSDILVVDDTPINHEVIKELLKKTGIGIDCAESGEEALEMTGAKHYDMIFLDQRMPGMNGSEVLKRIKEQKDGKCGSVPVILLTANTGAGLREKAMEEGFTDYLSKPIDSRWLEKMLIRYLPAEQVLS